jgi:cold shock CspA family protein
MRGRVYYWSPDRGYGKILGDDDVLYFVHVSALIGVQELRLNEGVEFDAADAPRGPRAIRVRVREVAIHAKRQ